ncbi:MAG: flagellar assembly protein FliW [Thermodesulfobacteriota bacterium]
MQIQTRAFGPIDIDEQQVLTLTEPMVGFPGHHRFAVLDPDPEAPFKWFQAVDREDLCFLIADPRHFFPDYRVELKAAALADLQLTEGSEAAVAVVLNVPGDPAQATANLLAPVIFNAGRKLARQMILDGSGHGVRTPLFPEEKRVCHGS